MQRKQHLAWSFAFFFVFFLVPQNAQAKINQHINAKSAILLDMDSGCVLFEQNADLQIPPASITKVLTLYIVFEAIKEGQVHLWDKVEVSRRAASTGGSRMGLKAGTRVPLEELIKGMAVVSGNDACVAVAEHLDGNVERFVRRMNVKARQLGMTRTRFMTPNGLPAAGQVTTARDIAKLSTAYLHRFPESLTIHSMQSYSYGKSSHHNANRLLGRCPGVDGLKTGFVCASGYNISATAKRGGTRVLAVVLGARTPWIRLAETEKLIEAGFRECGSPSATIKYASPGAPAKAVAASATGKSPRTVCRLQQKEVRANLVRANAERKRAKEAAERAKVARKPVKSKPAPAIKTVKAAAAAKICKPAPAMAVKKGKTVQVVRKKTDVKQTVSKSSKPAKNAKAQKSVKSSKKEQAKTVSGKKGPSKATPHANASKRKSKG